MAAHYYYLISTLPLLRLEDEPSLSSEDFLLRVAEHVTEAQIERLRDLAETPPVPEFCPAAQRWNEIEIYIRNSVLRNRSDTDRRRIEEWTREEQDVFPGLDPQIDDAVNAPNPLERERRLDRIRWTVLEEARFARPFEIDALAVYRLCLLMAEKWAAVDPTAGIERVREIADALRPNEQLREAGVA